MKKQIIAIIVVALAIVATVIFIIGANRPNETAPEEITTEVTATAETTTKAPVVTTEVTTTVAETTTEEVTTTTEATTTAPEESQTLAPVSTVSPEIQEAYDNGNLNVKPAQTTVSTTVKPAVTTTNSRGWTEEQQALYDMNSDLDPNFDPTGEGSVISDGNHYPIYAQ